MNHQLAQSNQSTKLASSVQASTKELSLVEREFGSLNDALASLNLTMSEHMGRLFPVLLQPTPVPAAPPGECVSEDLGEFGNNLRQARRQIEGVLALFSELRFRLTI